MNNLLVQGFRLAKAGDRNQAYESFSQVVKLDPSNEYGWLWRAQTTDDLAEAYVCLQRVLSINPNNEKAQRGIERIKNRVAGENVDLTGGAFESANSGFTGRAAPEDDFSGNPRAAQQTYNDTGADMPFDPNSFLGGTSQARPYEQPAGYGYQENPYNAGPTSGGYGAQPDPAYSEYDEAPQGQDYDGGAYPVPVADEERQPQRIPRRQPERRRGGFPIFPLLIGVLLLLLLFWLFTNFIATNNQAATTDTPTINAASATVPLVSDADQTRTAIAITGSSTTAPANVGTPVGTNPNLQQTIAAATAAVIGTQYAIQTSVAGGGGTTPLPTTTAAPAATNPTAPPVSTGPAPATTAPVVPTQVPPTNPPANVNTENADKRPAAYTVQRNNSLTGIAANYKTTPDAIVAANRGRGAAGISPIAALPNTLYFNTTLIIPVNRGDFRGQGVLLGENGLNTVQDVANRYNKSVDEIVRFNGLKDANDAKGGDALLIP